MNYLILLFVVSQCGPAEQFYQIEDIPIEQFVQTQELQDDAFDFELMPTQPRSLLHLRTDHTAFENDGVRVKRDVVESSTVSNEIKDVTSVINDIGKPLELVIIDPDNVTEETIVSSGLPIADETEDNNVLINDYIRFRRGAELKRQPDAGGMGDRNGEEQSENKPKHNVETFTRLRKLEVTPERSTKDRGSVPREPRGATKEQWVKQPYPVRNDRDPLIDDNVPDENVYRAPRVHFVTQAMAPPSREPRGYEPRSRSAIYPAPEPIRGRLEARAASGNFADRKLVRDLSSEMDYYYPRYSRPWRLERDDPYYYDRREVSRDRYGRGYDPYRYRETVRVPPRLPPSLPAAPYYGGPRAPYDDSTTVPPKRKQRRIIYYANLPDPPRSPPQVNLRDRYDYRDERYYGVPDGYRFGGKAYLKDRYADSSTTDQKSLYPLKVSTDLNVREVKKNPEGRIYSDVGAAQYGQNTQY